MANNSQWWLKNIFTSRTLQSLYCISLWKCLPLCPPPLRSFSTLSSCPPLVLCYRWTMRTLFVAVTLECSPPTMNHGDTHLVTFYHHIIICKRTGIYALKCAMFLKYRGAAVVTQMSTAATWRNDGLVQVYNAWQQSVYSVHPLHTVRQPKTDFNILYNQYTLCSKAACVKPRLHYSLCPTLFNVIRWWHHMLCKHAISSYQPIATQRAEGLQNGC